MFLSVFFPGVVFQSAFDEDRRAFAQVLGGYFRRASPKGDFNEGRLVDPFAVLALRRSFIAIPTSVRVCRRVCSANWMSRVKVAHQMTRL